MNIFIHLIIYTICMAVLLVSALTAQSSYGEERLDSSEGSAFICDVEMLTCRVVDSEMALGDSVGFFDQEGKLYAIGEVVRLDVGFRDIEIVQLFSEISDDATVRVISDAERKSNRLDKHTFRPKHLIGVSFAYKRLALVNSLAGFNYGVYFARSLRDNFSVYARSSYAYLEGSIEREEVDARHVFDVQAVIMSFDPGIAYEFFPLKNEVFALLLELGAGVSAVNSARPDGVRLDEEIAGTHLLLRAMFGLQLSVRDWRLQAGVEQQFIGSTGAHEFSATLVKGI